MSICAFASYHDPNRADQYPDVEPDGIVLNIVEVVFRVQVHGPVAASVNLPPAGHTLRHGKPFSLPGLVILYQVGQFRPGTHQTHMSAQYIEQLREFIRT